MQTHFCGGPSSLEMDRGREIAIPPFNLNEMRKSNGTTGVLRAPTDSFLLCQRLQFLFRISHLLFQQTGQVQRVGSRSRKGRTSTIYSCTSSFLLELVEQVSTTTLWGLPHLQNTKNIHINYPGGMWLFGNGFISTEMH